MVNTQKKSREDLKQLLILEDFKNSLPGVVAVYLNEQKVKKLEEAAVLADEYILAHKRVPKSRWVNSQGKLRNFTKTKQSEAGGAITEVSGAIISPCGNPRYRRSSAFIIGR